MGKWIVAIGCGFSLAAAVLVMKRFLDVGRAVSISPEEYEAKKAQFKTIKVIFIVNVVLITIVEMAIIYGLFIKN